MLKKTKGKYQTADFSESRFDFFFQRDTKPRCSFCKKQLDSELFFYKIGKAVTRKSVLAYGDISIEPKTYLMCKQCWYEKGLYAV